MNSAVIVHDSGVVLDTIIECVTIDFPDVLLLPYTHPQEFLTDLEQGLQFKVALVDLSLGTDRSIDGYDVMRRIFEERPEAKVYCVSCYNLNQTKASQLQKKVIYIDDSDFNGMAEAIGEACAD